MHDVEEADLDFAGEIGEFVDGENAAIGAGQQAVVDAEFVGDVLARAGGFDGIDVTDHVGDGDVGGGEFFDIAVVAAQPGDGSIVTVFGE